MNSAIERLLGLRVKDLMSQDVVQVHSHVTMAEAARTLAAHDISGAPVVDEEGHCVGILSATDFVQREGGRGEEVEHELVHTSPEQPFHIDEVAEDLVGSHMSSAIQTVANEASLLEAGRIMCAEHIHRLPVLDETGHVVGVISSLDLVAALTKAIEE